VYESFLRCLLNVARSSIALCGLCRAPTGTFIKLHVNAEPPSQAELVAEAITKRMRKAFNTNATEHYIGETLHRTHEFLKSQPDHLVRSLSLLMWTTLIASIIVSGLEAIISCAPEYCRHKAAAV
jgi:hypothetical protein